MNTSKTILLTGGRAPGTLELARLLGAAGHRVIVAESARLHLCSRSRFVARAYRVPSPREQPTDYISALCRIMKQEQVHLLIPTCEEIFYVAKGRDRLQSYGAVLTEGLDVLRSLHDKWLFGKLAREAGATVPNTVLSRSQKELKQALREASGPVVLKPVYSRFAAHVRIVADPHAAAMAELPEPSAEQPWLVQEFIEGRQLCSYAVAHEGRLLLYADYATTYTAGKGASIYFTYANDPRVKDFVSRFVERHRFSGQIAFDLIESRQGELYVIECNPRLTSGIHLFRGQKEAANAFLQQGSEVIVPLETGPPTMLAMAMMTYGLGGIRNWSDLKQWGNDFFSARDALHMPGDPWPYAAQFGMLADLAWSSIRTGKSMIECSTKDIEWNGEAPSVVEGSGFRKRM
ncbi:ATP-grasp domain-containing protein [uncultured Brevibacillus sp.]|uniref:ATP-grasp domain-containing protein n=1 Tax=uncultured Brevibacillus sp. TaxID=169970 RepID=UPI0025986199|nr:ATP-grasp domain-containing protein [uncultured Brevibacillus sp.]